MSEKIVQISKSEKPEKKLKALVDGKTIHFGAAGYQDYTTHKDPQRKERYIQRHKANEDWTKEGLKTSGFYSRYLLWNKPTIRESIQDLNKRYKDIKFKLKS